MFRPDGARVRRAVYGKSRKNVADNLSTIVTKTNAGLPLAVESWTVERFAEHWLTDVAAPRLRPATLSNYRATLRLHILPALGRVPLRALTPPRSVPCSPTGLLSALACGRYRSSTAPCAQC